MLLCLRLCVSVSVSVCMRVFACACDIGLVCSAWVVFCTLISEKLFNNASFHARWCIHSFMHAFTVIFMHAVLDTCMHTSLVITF